LTQDTVGNTIQNSQNINLNGQFNFVNLYNKSKYLKKINDKGKGGRPRSAHRKAAGKQSPTRRRQHGLQAGSHRNMKINPLEGLARVLMTLRTAPSPTARHRASCCLAMGPQHQHHGHVDGFGAPGFGFIMGQQNHDLSGEYVRDFATRGAQKVGWCHAQSIFNPYTNTRNETINGALELGAVQKHACGTDGQPHQGR
jgi:cell surface protein SprA